MGESRQEPELFGTCGEGRAADGQHEELADVVGTLEHSLQRVDALELTLVAALLDHCVAEAKRHLHG